MQLRNSKSETLFILEFSEPFCNRTWDRVSCWPETIAGQTSVIKCFTKLNGVLYDDRCKIFSFSCNLLFLKFSDFVFCSSDNATRECLENGTWALRADYGSCRALPHEEDGLKVKETSVYFN